MVNDLTIITNLIFEIRGQKVMIDRDLADLYEVETKKLNQAVKRNLKRFPTDFMFQLTDNEQRELVTNCDRLKILKHSSSNAYVFTEHGVTMLASILNSERAIEINVQIVRAFVQLRQFVLEHKDLTKRFAELEQYFMQYCKDNEADKQKIYEAIDLLMDRTKPTKVGFGVNNKE